MTTRRVSVTGIAGLSAILLLQTQLASADGYCYVVADQPGDDNAYVYDFTGGGPAATPTETPLTGDTNTSNIEASEFNPKDKTYYAWNANVFGTIAANWDAGNQAPDLASPGSGVFTAISTETSAICGLQGGSYVCGPNGTVGTGSNYDIDGMAYNPVSDIWYGAVRIDDGGGREDWLVVHDNTGNIIEDYFGYNDAPANTQPIGFVEIASQGGLGDIDDLGFNATTGELYGVANESGTSDTIIVGIDTSDGSTTDLGTLLLDNSSIPAACGTITGDAYLTDVEGVSIDLNGNIFAVTGTNGDNASSPDNPCLDSVMFFLGTVADLGSGDLDAAYLLQMSETDQESISCLVYDPVSVGDTIFEDRNGNGSPDAGEGVAGVVVEVYDASTGDLLGQQITDGNGNYLIDGLAPSATGYRVLVAATNFLAGGSLEGMVNTVDPDSPGAPDNQSVSGGLPNEGDANLTLDLGYELLNAIVGEVFEDLDGDTTRDPGENPITGVAVRLLDGGGIEVAATMTAADGSYQFLNLPPGDYTVEETDPAGYLSTSSNSVDVTLAPNTVGTADFGDLPSGATVLQLTATSFCSNDIPYVSYTVTPLGFSPTDVTIEWINNTVAPSYLARTDAAAGLSNTNLIWPGATESNGVPTDWPGWDFIANAWVADPSDLDIGPMLFRVSAGGNQAEVAVSYPTATASCEASPNGPVTSGPGTNGNGSDPAGVPVLHPAGLVFLGFSLLLLARRRLSL